VLKRTSGRPLIVAHRGSSGSAPENTLAAFRLAVDEGADMLELDVRMTRDFFLVVLHDQDIRRTTNGEGNVWDFSLQELRAFDAGVRFNARFKGERIPTLRQVMELLPSHVNLNIEMKTDGEPRQKLALEEACILAVMEKKLEERTIVSSFDHAYLKRFHHLFPAIRTGALAMPVRDALASPSRLARTLGTSAYICSKEQVNAGIVQDAHAHDIPVACYSINTEKDLDRMLKLGVDSVVSDHPHRMRELLGS
jgi:glycerophosphoryl diester phosphodiesterase